MQDEQLQRIREVNQQILRMSSYLKTENDDRRARKIRRDMVEKAKELEALTRGNVG